MAAGIALGRTTNADGHGGNAVKWSEAAIDNRSITQRAAECFSRQKRIEDGLLAVQRRVATVDEKYNDSVPEPPEPDHAVFSLAGIEGSQERALNVLESVLARL